MDTDGKQRIVRNILKRVNISSRIYDRGELFIDYDIKDGETPEIVAHKIYDRADYHWIIMLSNRIGLLWRDWPVSRNELSRIIDLKYGENNKYSIHHYETIDGYIVNSDAEDANPVSNTEYEERENEKKRTIRLLRPEYVSIAEKEIDKLLKV